MTDQRFAVLFGKKPEVWRPGLERIEAAFRELGSPGLETSHVTIGGTNGKGSTSALLWALLSTVDKKVGLFTSPHLVHFSERFLVSGQAITDQDCEAAWRQLETELSSEAYAALSFFEIATLLALRLYDAAKTDFNLIEVGMGGRLDACNILKPKAVAITSLGYDHMQYLGTTLPEIALEKIAIARKGHPVFLGQLGRSIDGTPVVEPEDQAAARATIERYCKELGAPLFAAGQAFWYHDEQIFVRLEEYGIQVDADLPEYVRQWPSYLRHNFLLACALFSYICYVEGWQDVTLNETLERLPYAADRLPAPPSLLGRFSELDAPLIKRRVLFDVCHNREGVAAFLSGIKTSGRYPQKMPAAVSILRDKPYQSMLQSFAEVFSPLVAFTLDHERGLTREEILACAPNAICVEGPKDAIKVLTNLASETETWVSCGSVLAVGLFLEACGLDPQNIALSQLLFGSVPRHSANHRRPGELGT